MFGYGIIFSTYLKSNRFLEIAWHQRIKPKLRAPALARPGDFDHGRAYWCRRNRARAKLTVPRIAGKVLVMFVAAVKAEFEFEGAGSALAAAMVSANQKRGIRVLGLRLWCGGQRLKL